MIETTDETCRHVLNFLGCEIAADEWIYQWVCEHCGWLYEKDET